MNTFILTGQGDFYKLEPAKLNEASKVRGDRVSDLLEWLLQSDSGDIDTAGLPNLAHVADLLADSQKTETNL